LSLPAQFLGSKDSHKDWIKFRGAGQQGTPSTGVTYSPLMHEYPRSPQAQMIEDQKIVVATVRLLLQGRSQEEVSPVVMRLRWEPTLGAWLLDEKIKLRREGGPMLPWF
jgi:hypothetical protein